MKLVHYFLCYCGRQLRAETGQEVWCNCEYAPGGGGALVVLGDSWQAGARRTL